MQNSTLDSSFVNRLKEILASRYGKGLQIRQLMDLSEVSFERQVFTRGRDLHIPIQVNGAYLGTAVVPSADDLNEEKRTGVAQLVRMVLEPAMYKWFLEQRESNLTEIGKSNVSFENVHIFGDGPLPTLDDILDEKSFMQNQSPGMELISSLIHLEGSSPTTNKKIALQLHEMTERWAFVPFNDIKGQLHSAFDIAKLGAMTVFIEKLETLNAPEQELLLEYLQEEHSEGEPLIITSSQLSLNELREQSLDSILIDEVEVNTFEVDRAPLTSKSLVEVLELFFMKEKPLDS